VRTVLRLAPSHSQPQVGGGAENSRSPLRCSSDLAPVVRSRVTSRAKQNDDLKRSSFSIGVTRFELATSWSRNQFSVGRNPMKTVAYARYVIDLRCCTRTGS